MSKPPPNPAPQPYVPAVGDWVEIAGMPGAAQVLEVDARRRRARVRLHDHEWVVAFKTLSATDPPHQPRNLPNLIKVTGSAPVRYELDLHGERVEDAIEKVERLLDQAVVHHLKSVRIIHGHGTGAVRKAVRTLLDRHHHVTHYRFGSPMEGGLACTIVELRQPRA